MSTGFGRNLHSLTLSFCKNIDLADLVPMTQLKELIIDKTCSMKESQTPIQVDTLFPCLKKLTAQICLDLFPSRILLQCKRPTLFELNLNCFHFQGWPDGHELIWKELPKSLPNLRRFSLNLNSPGLELGKLMQIFPLFNNLNKLQLPSSMIQIDAEQLLAWDLTAAFEERRVHLDFNGTKSVNCRVFLRNFR